MSGHTATPQLGVPGIRSLRDGARRLTSYWWVLLVAGIAWIAVSLVVLQFDQASVNTVGILVGLMFLGAGIENIALATLDVPMRWVWALFGGAFLVSANTVRTHMRHIYAKLDAHSRSEAVARARELGLVAPGAVRR